MTADQLMRPWMRAALGAARRQSDLRRWQGGSDGQRALATELRSEVTLVPISVRAPKARTAIRKRISEYSTRPCPLSSRAIRASRDWIYVANTFSIYSPPPRGLSGDAGLVAFANGRN